MASDQLIQLCCGALKLTLAPAQGGAILAFDCIHDNRRWPILRGCDGPPAHLFDAASFPLVPFCNRIRGGRFSFRGREVELSPNLDKDPSPLHGQGWLAAWAVERSTETEAELVY